MSRRNRRKHKSIKASDQQKQIISMAAPVKISAEQGEDGEPQGPPRFEVVANTGQKMQLSGWDEDVVLDIQGAEFAKRIVANLDHDEQRRVGQVSAKTKTDGEIILAGTASAATEARREVIESSNNGFEWEASIEADPKKVSKVKAGQTKEVNGQQMEGPFYHVEASKVYGFAFVSRGADSETSVKIAAKAAKPIKGKSKMDDQELLEQIQAMFPSIDVNELGDEDLENFKRNIEGKHSKPKKRTSLTDGVQARREESDRQSKITELALKACDASQSATEMEAIEALANNAIEAKSTVEQFQLELLQASAPANRGITISSRRGKKMNSKVIEAAVCMAGGMQNIDDKFDDQTLQMAHDRFPHGIGLRQLVLLAAEDNGYRADAGGMITIEAQRAAFKMHAPMTVKASMFSGIDLPVILRDSTNKFFREGFMAVERDCLSLAPVRSVRNLQEISTASLIGDMEFKKVAGDGEITHGTIGEETYTNKADTYARMASVTREDYLNDDLAALTTAPRRLGRGGMLKLNDIFWTEFLDNGTFFTAARNNVLLGGGGNSAQIDNEGLDRADTLFGKQTDPDGNPLGEMPRILVVPKQLNGQAMRWMNSERLVTGNTALEGDTNIWNGRFRVVTSSYMDNANYTGNSAVAWYLIADPNSLPVIEIVALNGRIEPTVETADADFNVLGFQVRAYNDVGVRKQEYRAGIRSDGLPA